MFSPMLYISCLVFCNWFLLRHRYSIITEVWQQLENINHVNCINWLLNNIPLKCLTTSLAFFNYCIIYYANIDFPTHCHNRNSYSSKCLFTYSGLNVQDTHDMVSNHKEEPNLTKGVHKTNPTKLAKEGT